MSQKTTLKNKGIYTDPNQLSSIPEGAMLVADNIVINRENVVEPRRGFNQYGNTFGIASDRAKQLLTYKNRILAHYNDKLIYNDNPHNNVVDGNFLEFDGSYTELETGLRIKSVESNKNFFFTTNDGIKKISARTAADFTTAAGFIQDAGAIKALDITGTLNSTTEGFLPPNSEVAYRLVWTYKDLNENLIAGSPSSRLVMSNASNSNANVDLQFAIPQNITSDYFYQIYRTAVFTATGSLTLDDIDPDNELQLIYEDYPTTVELTNGLVNVTDLSPEDFRAGGLPLYTNSQSGDGLISANGPPPKAKDVTMYQSTVFYANTETRANTTITLLGVDDLVSGTSYIQIDNTIDTPQIYTFVGQKEVTNVDFSSYSGTIPTDLNGKYFLINSASDKRKYYVWYDNTKTEQIIDFTNYVYTTAANIKTNLKETFFLLYTKDPERVYYVWYDSTGTDVNPGTNPNNGLTGYSGIRVDISAITSINDVAVATEAAISAGDIDDDFDTSIALDVVTVASESFDDTQYTVIETLQNGFSFTFSTPLNDDPANNLITNDDVVGRIGMRINVSRGVTTVVHVADATAAGITEQDSALDFEVDYTAATSVLDITNTNNGNTTDARDSSINPVGNSFTISVTTQGDGEDVSGTITATTTGATITITSADNLLANGDNILISGSDTTPSIDGNHVVSNVTRDSFDITPASAITIAGTTGNWRQVDNHVLLSTTSSPAQKIDETARSLVNIINKNSDETVYAFYTSGTNDLPGKILLEVKDIGVNQFFVTANNAATGGVFNPSLPPYAGAADVTGEAEIKPNRIYYAKLQQPEAVPALNFIDVGPEDKSIFRILALRESLFILKEDGVYRLTGSNGSYAVDLFDGSTKIIAPDTAVVINNQIYCLTNLGIVTISDTGVTVISNPIKSDIQILSSDSYDYVHTSFGISYENDYSYLLWLPSQKTDTVATRVYRYSTDNQLFTTHTMSKTCGIVNPGDDKIYLGPSDVNYLERERKLFNRTDFADRDFTLTIPINAVDGTTLTLSSSTDVSVGDALVQTQYVTISEYNQLLQKLDLDPSIGQAEITKFDFSSYTGSIPNDLHSKYFILYSATDSTRYAIFYDAQGDLPSLDTNVFNDIADAQQIRVDISSGVITKADLAQATKTAIQSNTFDFVVSYTTLDEFFQTTTIRNGTTSDASDSAVNGLNNGFAVTILTQGFGDYFDSLQMLQGDSIYSKITALATKLDADPGVNDSDYVASLGSLTTFEEAQIAFNVIVDKLNLDTGVSYQNYLESEGTKEFEVLILEKIINSNNVILQFSIPLMEGPIQVYESISCVVHYAPETFGDTSLLKQVPEATIIFQDNNFSRATVGFKTDLSPGFEEIDFTKSGKGDWGFFINSQHNWGGGFSGVPLRTYVPRQKQRCRYIQLEFIHSSAREGFILYGFSYSYRIISERAYRS